MPDAVMVAKQLNGCVIQSGEATLGSDEQRSCDRLLYQSGEPL